MTSPTTQTQPGQAAWRRDALSGASGGFGRIRALATLYVLTLRQHMHGKRWMFMGLLLLLPAALGLLVRSTAGEVPGRALEFALLFMFLPHALLPLVALIYASGIIQDEQEEQTLTYLMMRPISKFAMYCVKLLATITTTVLLTFIFTAVCFAVIYIGADDAGAEIPLRALKVGTIHALAMAAYCCLFGLMGLLIKRVLIAGLIYIAVVEGLLANLPFGIRLITVIYYARLMAYRTVDFVIAGPDGRLENPVAEVWQLDVYRDPELLAHPQLGTCLTVLVVSSLVFAVLAGWMCNQREFHVKTPEKD